MFYMHWKIYMNLYKIATLAINWLLYTGGCFIEVILLCAYFLKSGLQELPFFNTAAQKFSIHYMI